MSGVLQRLRPVVEEKQSPVAELLPATVKPWQLQLVVPGVIGVLEAVGAGVRTLGAAHRRAGEPAGGARRAGGPQLLARFFGVHSVKPALRASSAVRNQNSALVRL